MEMRLEASLPDPNHAAVAKRQFVAIGSMGNLKAAHYGPFCWLLRVENTQSPEVTSER